MRHRLHSGAFVSVIAALGVVSCVSTTSPKTQTAHATPTAMPPPAAQLPVTHEGPKGGDQPALPGMTALGEELDRAMGTLGKATPSAHYLAYTVTHHEDVNLRASNGALEGDTHGEGRVLDVDVLVGTPALDSNHASRLVARPRGHSRALPLEGADPLVLRQVAWSETDRAYKDATERFIAIKDQRQSRAEEEDTSPDFSSETPTHYIGEAAPPLGLDAEAWRKRLRGLSAKFKGEKEVYESNVSLSAHRATRWFLGSDGARMQLGVRTYRITISASTQAADGMHLSRFKSFEAFTPDTLPSDATMSLAITEMVDALKALRRAPLAEPFAGPAILEGRASGVFFHEVIGHRLEAHRLRNDDDGQTFGKKLGQEVMPPFLSLYDDPTLLKIGDTELNGHYLFDDEGVPGERASLVDKGVLRGFLFGRTPALGIVHSNGHGRRQEGMPLVARQGNLVLEASQTVPVSTLRSRLVEDAKKQGKPYGLRFVDITGGFTDTSRAGTQGFKVMPTMVYRVYADGRPDELIRGVDIVGTPLSMLMKIEAAGDDHDVFNGVCGAESGWVPVSATAPSLLIGQLETARSAKSNDKPPVLQAPSFGSEEEESQ